MPLAHYLKNYFAQHKKHGSKDRKYISQICYCYYRLGQALKNLCVEERLKAAIFLCNDEISEWAILYDEIWLEQHNPALNARIAFLHEIHSFAVQQIFPWQADFSDEIDAEAFAISHLTQPNLFLRVRPDKKETVIQKLQSANIQFQQIGENGLVLANNSQADKTITLNKEAVVQDYSSQQISSFFQYIQLETVQMDPLGKNRKLDIWDCCAASGGKSIMAYDIFKNITLTVSDVRTSIIHNLRQRFAEAGIKNYTSLVADLSNSPFTTDPAPILGSGRHSPYDLIICDAPCTGSGTWGRTPEQLYFFTQDKIRNYSTLQRKIVQTTLPYTKKDGYFLYITCSIFSDENEAAVDLIQQQGFTLVKKAVLAGYDKKADTMFAALLKK